MTKEMKKLQKEINGKRLTWIGESFKNAPIDAICIWPPEGSQLSIKPYGYTAEELYGILINRDPKMQFSIDTFSNPSFCLATHEFPSDGSTLNSIRTIANLKEGEDYIFTEITGKPTDIFGSPSCPYG